MKITFHLLLLTVLGSGSQDIKLKGFDKACNFGVAKEFNIPNKIEKKLYVQKFILRMIFLGYLKEEFKKKDIPKGRTHDSSCSEYVIYLAHGNIDEFYKITEFFLLSLHKS